MILRRIARGNQVVEFVLIVALALGLAFAIQAFIIKPYRIPSGSMEPTLSIGQRVLVDRIGNDFFPPAVGDIVVFHPPAGAANQICGAKSYSSREPCPKPTPQEARNTNYIKRVVAGPRRHDRDRRRSRVAQRQGAEGEVRELRRLHDRGRRLQLPAGDQDSGRLLLHDGRQP